MAIKAIQRLAKRDKRLVIMTDGPVNVWKQETRDDAGNIATFIVAVPLTQDVTLLTWNKKPRHRARIVGVFNPWDRVVIRVMSSVDITTRRVTLDNAKVTGAVKPQTRQQEQREKHTVMREFSNVDFFTLSGFDSIASL